MPLADLGCLLGRLDRKAEAQQVLSEKAGINLPENTGSSKPMEDFIRQFTGSSGSAGNGDPLKRQTPDAAEKVAS